MEHSCSPNRRVPAACAAIWIAIATVLAAGCASSGGSATAQSSGEVNEETNLETVAVVNPDRADLARSLALTGEFRANQEVEIHAKVAGYIQSLSVDVGDVVKAGQLIAEIEVPEMQDELSGAEASRQQIEAELSRLQRELERSESDSKVAEALSSRLSSVDQSQPGLIAQQELDEARGRYDSLQSRVQAAQAALEAARQQLAGSRAAQTRAETMLAYRLITAPFAGVITHRYADPGAMVRSANSSSSQPIVRLAEIRTLRLVVPVPEDSAAKITEGTQVEIYVAALDRRFPARVARRSYSLNRSTSTMGVEIDVANRDHSLLPGMYADASFLLDKRPAALTVPIQAVLKRDGNETVMLVGSDGRLAERAVRTGMALGGQIEILSGLTDGDAVVVGDRARLKPGQRVQTKVVTVG